MSPDNFVLLLTFGWLFVGGIVLRPFCDPWTRTLHEACAGPANKLADLAQRLFRYVRGSQVRLGALLRRSVLELLPRPSGAAAPAPSDAVQIEQHQNGLITFFVFALLLSASVLNYAFVADVFADLFDLSLRDRQQGLGWWVAGFGPGVLVAGEVIGGILYAARQTSNTARIGLVIFFSCILCELGAAFRRFIEFALPTEPGVPVDIAGVVIGGAFLVLAVVLPTVIAACSASLAPILRPRSVALSPLPEASGGILRPFFRWTLMAFATAVLGLLYLVLSLALFAALGVMHLVRLAISPVLGFALVALVVIGIKAPAALLDRLAEIARNVRSAVRRSPSRESGRVTPVVCVALLSWVSMLIGALLLMSGCNQAAAVATAPAAIGVRHFDDQPASPFNLDEILELRPSKLPSFVESRVAVNRIESPRLYACLVDATGSIPKKTRRLMLESCASKVAHAEPETTAVVLLIGSDGDSSDVAMKIRQAPLVTTHCMMEPSLPELDNTTGLFKNYWKRARAERAEVLDYCVEQLNQERQVSQEGIESQAMTWVKTQPENLE